MRIEPGEYKAKAEMWELGQTKSGDTQIIVQFALTTAGKRITWYGHLGEKSYARTFNAMTSCGWTGDLDNLEGLEKNEVSLVIEDSVYLGKVTSKVAFVNGTRPPAVPVTPNQKELLKKRLAAWKNPAAAAPAQPVDLGSDNVPF